MDMRPRALKRRHKELLSSAGFDPKAYWLMYDGENIVTIKSKETGEITVIEKR